MSLLPYYSTNFVFNLLSVISVVWEYYSGYQELMKKKTRVRTNNFHIIENDTHYHIWISIPHSTTKNPSSSSSFKEHALGSSQPLTCSKILSYPCDSVSSVVISSLNIFSFIDLLFSYLAVFGKPIGHLFTSLNSVSFTFPVELEFLFPLFALNLEPLRNIHIFFIK